MLKTIRSFQTGWKTLSKIRCGNYSFKSKNAIIEDYPTSKFTITNNLANVITVQFHFEINPKELIYYMNALLNDERLTDYQLHKLINDWGIQVNQSIMAFSMKSLWIK